MSRKDFKPGATLREKYEIIEVVGTGGMGQVLKAKRLLDGVFVAIKYCVSRDPDHLRRFAREVRVMKTIEHDNVVPILKSGLNFVPPYFVMPLAAGNLRSELEQMKGNESLALEAFFQFCDGVQAIHSAGAVHRDIKPDNALRLEGRVVVADLGLAKFEQRDSTILTRTSMFLGTDCYWAPEQRARGGSRDADIRTDVYQLGKMLYEMLTNSDPTLMDFTNVSPGLSHVIRKATRDLPAERYQTVGALIDAIKVYQLAKDPASNPTAVFETTLSNISDRLTRHEYREKDFRTLLAVFAIPEVRAESSQYLELFDRIPDEVLLKCAEDFVEDLLPVVEAYVQAIDAVISGKSFGYAETIAGKMKPLFRVPSDSPRLKALALEAILVGAVSRNRFAAMDVFNALLPEVQDEDDAVEVAEMLRRRRSEYGAICTLIPAIKLHVTIRAVRDELVAEEEKRKEQMKKEASL